MESLKPSMAKTKNLRFEGKCFQLKRMNNEK
jgi:hypothetical protein